MAEMNVLLVGGPMGGQWVKIPRDQRDVIMADPDSWRVFPSFNETPTPSMTPFKRLRYVVHPEMQIFRWKIRVAIFEAEKMSVVEKEVLKAILQRDVANEMGLFR